MTRETDRVTEQDFRNAGVTERNFRNAMSHDQASSFYHPEIFVGQEAPRKELVRIITQSPPGTVAIVSEELGLGKTTLMCDVIHDLVDNGHIKFSEIHHAFAIGRNLNTTAFGDKHTSDKPKVCFVEELDQRSNIRKNLEYQLIQASKLLDQIPIVVLIGDRTLRNPSIIKLIDSPYEPIYVPLNPLTPDLFKKIVEARLTSYFAKDIITDLEDQFYRVVYSRLRKEGHALDTFGDAVDRKIKEVESRISPEEVDRIFDTEFLAYFIPNTKPNTANTRHALYSLGMLIANLNNPNNPIMISGELLTKKRTREREDAWNKIWQADNYADKQKEFIIWLHDYIRHNYDGSVPFRELSADELRQKCPLDISTAEEYEEKILRPLGTSILIPTGIPYLNDGHQIQGPYLPHQQTFLEAKYGQVSEVKQPSIYTQPTLF